MTHIVTARIRSRSGNGAPVAVASGSEKAASPEIGPRAPAHAITSQARQPVAVDRPLARDAPSSPSTNAPRATARTTATSGTSSAAWRSSAASSRRRVSGSSVPTRVNATAWSTNVSCRHTAPTCSRPRYRGSDDVPWATTRPATTTARIPEPSSRSAPT